jgi:aspartate aminotransferase-like enzyme
MFTASSGPDQVEWGRAVDPRKWPRGWTPIPAIKAVFVQANETSTGVQHPVKELAAVTKDRPGTILVVDAISALGGYELPMDDWGIDVRGGGLPEGHDAAAGAGLCGPELPRPGKWSRPPPAQILF